MKQDTINNNMTPKSELVGRIKNFFNLNIYETKAWLALIEKGIASASDIAEISGVPRSRTYDVLESLEKRGFAIAKLGKPVKFIAVKPAVIIEKLKSNTMQDAQSKITTLSNLKGTQEYTELEQIYTSGLTSFKREEISGALKGKSMIYSHLRELLENAKKEIVLCTSTKEFDAKSRLFLPLLAKLAKSNTKIRVALNGPEIEIRRLSNKFKLKIAKMDINTRLFIVDKSQVLFTLNDDSTQDENEIGIWINSDLFASTLSHLFDFSMRGK